MTFTFNARNVQPLQSFEPWVDGWYSVVIRKSNMKPVNDNPNAGYLQLDIEDSQGRVNFIRLNLQNPNETAMTIANRTLSSICHVTGTYDLQEMPGPDNCVPMLHNKP